MNLPETAFLVAHADGFGLRWFTPTVEVDLCGHATLAATLDPASAASNRPSPPSGAPDVTVWSMSSRFTHVTALPASTSTRPDLN